MAANATISRLEARVKPEVYELIREASMLEGMTISAFVVSAVTKVAEEKIERSKLLRLASEDQAVFADALLRGAKNPTAAFIEAAALHNKLVR